MEITPAGWTFAIWGFIYIYQVIWVVYGLSTLFRKTRTGGYLYYEPPFMSPWLYIVYSINMCLNVSWVLLFSREMLWQALIVIILMALTLYICIFISARDLVKYGPELINLGQSHNIWLVRFLVHNAWGMYASWVTIATLLNLGIVFTYVIGISQPIASTISLCILAIETVAYFWLDNFAFDRQLRYNVTPYIVLHVALIGSLSKNWDPTNCNTILTLALLVLGVSLTCVKIGLLIWRSVRNPIFEAEKQSLDIEIH